MAGDGTNDFESHANDAESHTNDPESDTNDTGIDANDLEIDIIAWYLVFQAKMGGLRVDGRLGDLCERRGRGRNGRAGREKTRR